MELALFYIAAFLRPIFFIDLGDGANLFDFAAIVIFVLLLLAFLSNTAQTRGLVISAIDIVILGFAIWCITAFFVYFDKANAREVAKLLIPLFTFIVAKNVMRSADDYKRALQLMIIAFSIPILWSAVLIVQGEGIETTNYWTGLNRFKGAFSGSHTMGHSMTFFVMLVMLARTLSKGKHDALWSSRARKIGIGLLTAVALYCLYKSQVRTAMVGLGVFLAVYLYAYNKRMLVIVGSSITVILIVALPYLRPVLFFDLLMAEKVEGKWSIEDLGSGRQDIWMNNLSIFQAMPLDRQLAGAGIGNKVQLGGEEGVVDSHSDVLDILMQTGAVGFLLYITLQLLLVRAIWRLPQQERPVFLAVFLATTVMNCVSNSYVTRFGLAQMLYMVMAFVQLRVYALPETPRQPIVVRA